jgi:hypothetical protein
VAAEKLASEIGRDFSPGTTSAPSTWALALGICFHPLKLEIHLFSSLFSVL